MPTRKVSWGKGDGDMGIATTKIGFASAAGALALSYIAVAAPAHGAPCLAGSPDFSAQACSDCAYQYGHGSPEFVPNCVGIQAPAAPLPADCQQYTVASNRAICTDQHLDGQR